VHRRRVLLRAALRAALADEIGVHPASVPLGRAPGGRPRLTEQRTDRPVDVSCSASGDVGVVAVSRDRRVGVDVQEVEPWDPDVLDEGWLTPTEQRALAVLPPGERASALARAWTQKEAVLKARGTGLTGPPREPETVIGRRTGEVAGWEISDVPVPGGWVASLALGPAPDEETS
jgi:4'-phosphopantetheinyl transferase